MARNTSGLKPFKKGDKRASECGKKSKPNPSIKAAMKRLIESGEVDINQYTKSLFINAMKGNSGIAKILSEYIDGKVADKLELEGNVNNVLTFEEVASKK